eukprot:1158209-Pelagomonas_calceolata.AAC.5
MVISGLARQLWVPGRTDYAELKEEQIGTLIIWAGALDERIWGWEVGQGSPAQSSHMPYRIFHPPAFPAKKQKGHEVRGTPAPPPLAAAPPAATPRAAAPSTAAPSLPAGLQVLQQCSPHQCTASAEGKLAQARACSHGGRSSSSSSEEDGTSSSGKGSNGEGSSDD